VLCRTETASKAELSVCGNGEIEPGEACDDGNTRDGDGCSAICVLEARFPPQSDAELSSWAANAEGPDLAMLYDHLTSEPAWLGAFGGQPVREVVAASIRVDVLPESLSVQTAGAVAPLLPRRGHAVNCHDARAWLAWTGAGLGIRDDVNAFYKRWCEICTIRHPDLTVPRNECRRRKTDGYHEVEGLCRHVDNTPYLSDCALPATNP
jgi:cysteine-rich repeat protein